MWYYHAERGSQCHGKFVVHRGQDAEVAVGDRDASVLSGASAASPTGANYTSSAVERLSTQSVSSHAG